jgi:hypothetical protein
MKKEDKRDKVKKIKKKEDKMIRVKEGKKIRG